MAAPLCVLSKTGRVVRYWAIKHAHKMTHFSFSASRRSRRHKPLEGAHYSTNKPRVSLSTKSHSTYFAFTNSIPSSKFFTGMIGRIGPKISSLMSESSGVTSRTIVGAMNRCAASVPPPRTTVPFVLSRRPFTRLKCASETMRE